MSRSDRYAAKAHGSAVLWKPRHGLVTGMRGKRAVSENSFAMLPEPLSPELALVDPELGARARAALPTRAPAPIRPRPAVAAAPPAVSTASAETRPYPIWARMTAALWLLVVGMLIGGTAIPHAQDRPRVIPPGEDATICPRPAEPSAPDQPPSGSSNPFGP